MSITDRDRKIVFLLVPIALIAAYWFLVLAPKRQEESKIKDQLGQAQTARATAQRAASQLGGAKRNFETDYAHGHLPSSASRFRAAVDMPSLLVQLDRASQGTGIQFVDVKAGQRTRQQLRRRRGAVRLGRLQLAGGRPRPDLTPPNGGSGPVEQQHARAERTWPGGTVGPAVR